MLKVNNKDNRTPFDNVVQVYIFSSFNLKHALHHFLVFFVSTLDLKMPNKIGLW